MVHMSHRALHLHSHRTVVVAALTSSVASAHTQDDDLDVVVAALGLPVTPSLPPAALLHSLQPTLRRISHLLCGPAKASQGTRAAASAARKAMHAVATVAAAQQEGVEAGGEGGGVGVRCEARDQALLLLLQFVLPVRRALKVCCVGQRGCVSLCCVP